MAESPNLKVKVVELLGVWPGEAKVGSPPVEQPVVIVTVRPENTLIRTGYEEFEYPDAQDPGGSRSPAGEAAVGETRQRGPGGRCRRVY